MDRSRRSVRLSRVTALETHIDELVVHGRASRQDCTTGDGSVGGLETRHDATNGTCRMEQVENERACIRRRFRFVCEKAWLRRWVEWFRRPEDHARQKPDACQRFAVRQASSCGSSIWCSSPVTNIFGRRQSSCL